MGQRTQADEVWAKPCLLLTFRSKGGRKGRVSNPGRKEGEVWYIQRRDERHPGALGPPSPLRVRAAVLLLVPVVGVPVAAQTEAALERGQRVLTGCSHSWCS